jgi:hypothetical protein
MPADVTPRSSASNGKNVYTTAWVTRPQNEMIQPAQTMGFIRTSAKLALVSSDRTRGGERSIHTSPSTNVTITRPALAMNVARYPAA